MIAVRLEAPLRVLPIASVATVMFDLAKSAVIRDYGMPPLMLSTAELEAAVLGAQWVADRGDPGLANVARDLLANIAHVVRDHLHSIIITLGVGAAPAATRRSMASAWRGCVPRSARGARCASATAIRLAARARHLTDDRRLR